MSEFTGFVVLDPGPATTVQDTGRPGLAHLGVPPSGAWDVPAAALADRLVGNLPDRALLETTLAGPTLRRVGPALWVAVTGAPCEVWVGDRAVGPEHAVRVRDAEVLRLGRVVRGVRSYLAVAGGFTVPPVLGSRSTDVLSGLGPPRLAAGMELPTGQPDGPVTDVDEAPERAASGDLLLRVTRGPREDRFAGDAWELLTSRAWTVTPESNRVGLRLSGPRLQWASEAQLPPEPMVTGALQVPPSGQLVLFGPDHPVTGGYPVIAVVDDAGVAATAQAAPGTRLRFA